MDSPWEFKKRQIVYSAIGVLCHGVLSWVNIVFNSPALGYINLVIPIFFGIVFGPWVGLIVGTVGALGGTLGHWDLWTLPALNQTNGGVMRFIPSPFLWVVSDGLTGFITGLFKSRIKQYNRRKDIATAICAGILGIIVGILCEWLFYLSRIDWGLIRELPLAIVEEPGVAILGIALEIEGFFIQYGFEFLREVFAVIVLLPIFMLAYYATISRRGSSNTT